MKPKPQYRTIKTREDDGITTPAINDGRFPLFYENVDREDNGLYDIIGDISKNTWIYDDDKGESNVQHLPAENTVFINANIALTDGSCKKFNIEGKTPRTIPNLYDALTALATKISDIHNQINTSYSNADKYLYVTKDETDKSVTISPGNFNENTNTTEIDNASEKIQITNGKGTTSIAITNNDIQFTIKPNADDTDSHTYNLGAIIEAIQELNRRTAFIDSTMTFDEAKNHFDVNDGDSVTGASYQKIDDGLPAATNGHYGEDLGPGNIRSITNEKLPKMKIISYDPITNKTIDETCKNIPFTQEISTLNNNSLLDDPTVISPESVAIRMRGCPYLLE